MIYLEDIRKPLFTSRREQKQIKVRAEPVLEDATGQVIALIATLVAVLVLAFLASQHGLQIATWMMDKLPVAGAESVMYVNVQPDSTLNARLSPNKKADVEYHLERGEQVTVVAIAAGWAECRISEDTVYCSIDYLTSTIPQDEPIAATIASNGRVALRDAPGGSRIGWLQAGDKVTVIGYVNSWAHIEGGYVAGEYVEAPQ